MTNLVVNFMNTMTYKNLYILSELRKLGYILLSSLSADLKEYPKELVGNWMRLGKVTYRVFAQNGQIYVGCHPQVSGSFFNHSLVPTFDGPVPCSAKACVCLDMYSFLEDVNRNTDVNPLHIYSDILKRKRGITSFFL